MKDSDFSVTEVRDDCARFADTCRQGKTVETSGAQWKRLADSLLTAYEVA